MEMDATKTQTDKRQKIFPWFKIFLDKFKRNFPNDCDEDLLHHLTENINNEIKALSVKHDRKRLKILFETVQDLFLHFWWRIRWKGEKMWKKYWKKDYTDIFSYDLRTKCVVKLLYFMIYIGILLSKGATDSLWIRGSLQAIKVFPDCDNIIYSSLLLVKNIKRKYRPSYCEILKFVLISKATKRISEPVVYIKILILFRRLKEILKASDPNSKRDLLSAALKFQAPPNLIPWMASFDLDVSKIKRKNLAQYIFKRSFKDLFQKLLIIVGEYEFLPTEKGSKESKNRDTNQESLLHLDSTLNFFPSPGDSEVLGKESLSIQSDKKKRKSRKKKKRRNKVNSKFEKERSGSTAALDKTRLESFNKEDDNETVHLSFVPSLSIDINKSAINLDETHSVSYKNGEDNECENLSFTQSSLMSVNKTTVNSNETDSVSFNSKKDNNGDDIGSTSSSLRNVNCTALTLAEIHPVSFNNGNDNAPTNLGNMPSSPTCVNNSVLNLDDINSRNRSVNLSLQPSSPKQNTLLFNSESQLNARNHQIPLLSKDNEKTMKLSITAEKTNKKKTLSNKLSLSKNKKKPVEASCKKFKLFNTDLFEIHRKSIEKQTIKNVLCDANISSESTPLSISTNENSACNVNMLQNSSEGKLILPSDQVNRPSVSSDCEKSCFKNAAKDQDYSHGEDNEAYNNQSLPIFDSMPDSPADMGNSLHDNTNNSTRVLLDVNHPKTVNSLRTPMLYKENDILNATCEDSRNEANIANGGTDHVANHIPIHLQHTNIINPDSQFPPGDSNSNLSQNDSEFRHEHCNSLNNSAILEQLCNNFNSFTNLNSNSNSGSFSLNECHQSDPRICSGNQNVEYSGNQNLNQTSNGKNAVEVFTNGVVFPQNKSNCTTCDGNTSFVIDCNFVNLNQPNTECKSKNTDISSIKVIINLNNKKQDGHMHKSNGHCASNFGFAATSLAASSPSSSFTDSFNLSQRNALPVTSLSQVMPECNGNSCSYHQIDNSHKEMPTHTQGQMGVPLNPTASTPCKRYLKTSTPLPFNKSHNKSNDFLAPLQHAHTTSQQRTSTDGSEFYTPHTSDCESDGPVQETSPANVSSLQKKYIERYVQSVSNSTHVNLTPAFTSLQNHQIQHSSLSGSKQHKKANNVTSSQTSPFSQNTYRKSVRDVYSDVSGDDISVSSLGIISDEETDHSLMRGSSGHSASESPLKKKSTGSNDHCRRRTISNSSIEHHSTPEDSCRRTKKVSFSNLDSGETNTNKGTLNSQPVTSRSTQTKGRKRKRKAIQTVSRYNFRSRKQMRIPAKMTDYMMQKC